MIWKWASYAWSRALVSNTLETPLGSATKSIFQFERVLSQYFTAVNTHCCRLVACGMRCIERQLAVGRCVGGDGSAYTRSARHLLQLRRLSIVGAARQCFCRAEYAAGERMSTEKRGIILSAGGGALLCCQRSTVYLVDTSYASDSMLVVTMRAPLRPLHILCTRSAGGCASKF